MRNEISILHVDDEPSLRDLTKTFLERNDEQFTVETARSADEGLEMLGDRPPDCIVSDYNMPGMDGLEFLEVVRADYPDLPFILLTGKGSEEVASDAIAADVTDYLQKGTGTEQYELLANRIHNAVQARRDAERATRQEQLMRLTEFAGNTGGFELDRESGTILLTAGTRRIIGRPDKSEISLQEAIELFHPDEQADIQQTLTEAFQTGEELQRTWRLQPADGDERVLDLTITPVVEDGEVTKLRGAGHDTTDRKQRDRQLKRVTDLISNTEELADTGAWEYDSKTETLMLTDGARRVYGLSAGADLSLNEAFEAFHPDDRDLLEERFRNCLETGEPYEMDVRLTTTDGEQRCITARAERVADDESGSVVRGYIRDITEQKQRERRLTELNQATQALLTAETSQEVADIGVEAASDVIDRQANAICFSEADDTRLVPVTQTDEVASRIGDTQPLPVAGSIAGRVYRSGEPAVIPEVQQDPDVHDFETDLGAQVYLPLGDHGILIAGSEKRAAFDKQDLALGELLAGTLVAALDRVEREATARQRQQQLSLFFHESPLGAVQWDDEFRFERINERAEELLGYDEAALRGKSWETIVADEDSDRVGDTVEKLLAVGGGTNVRNTNVRRDGEMITCEWHNRALTDADGDVQSIFSKFQDVTEREDRKRELEEYETIIEALTDAVYVLDEDGQFTYVNHEFVELVEYDRETILGNTPSLIKDEGAVERAEQELGRLLSSDGPDTVAFEVTVHPRDGDPVVCEDHMGVLPYDGDKFNGSVGTLRDITDRKERKQELQAVKRQYQTLVETFPDGAVFLYDTDLRVVRAGGSELSAVGLSADTLEGTTPHDRYPPEIADELVHYLENAVNGHEATFEQEHEGERYRIRTLPARNRDGEIAYVMAVSQRITEQTERRQELKTQNERLEEFASIVSHDLRNPLGVADGYVELAQETRESDNLAQAADALDRSQALIDDLLTLAREGDQVEETESVGLGDVARNSWQTVETAQATLGVAASEAVQADRSRLQQLFENLYRNAVEHGGESVTIHVGEIDGGFYVADTGPGIPESERDAVFEAGYSTAEQGTGFGLRIVKQIVEAHGWTITLTESKQGGARFDITGVETPA